MGGKHRATIDTKHTITLVFTEAAIDVVLHEGYNVQLGVRELDRVIKKSIQVPLIKDLARGHDLYSNWIIDAKDYQIIIIKSN